MTPQAYTVLFVLITHDQELLILWNGFKLVNVINSISGDRVAAASYVRATMQRLGHVQVECDIKLANVAGSQQAV